MGGIMMPYMGDMGQQGYVTPNQIPNLSLWYNASASTTVVNGVTKNNFQGAVVNGTSISKWVDLQAVGGDANVTGGAGKQPTYTIPIQNGLGSVTYNAVNSNNLDINPTAFAANKAGLTLYVVSRPTSTPATAFPLVVTDQSLGIWWNGTNWTTGVTVGNSGTATVTNDTTKFHIYGLVYDGSQTGNANRLQFRYDKSSQSLTFAGTIPATTGAQSYMYFGGDDRSGGNGGALSGTYMTGYIGEVLIWQRTLSSTEIGSVEYYINQKWGMGLA